MRLKSRGIWPPNPDVPYKPKSKADNPRDICCTSGLSGASLCVFVCLQSSVRECVRVQQISFGLPALDLAFYVTSRFWSKYLDYSPSEDLVGCPASSMYGSSTVANVLAEHSRLLMYGANRTGQSKEICCNRVRLSSKASSHGRVSVHVSLVANMHSCTHTLPLSLPFCRWGRWRCVGTR